MTEERKARIKELRARLTAMTTEERQALVLKHGVVTVEGRSLSIKNQCLLILQNIAVTVVGGYRQWQAAGRQVRKGEQGMLIWFPVGAKNEEGDITEAERFFTASVFDVSQTESKEAAVKTELVAV